MSDEPKQESKSAKAPAKPALARAAESTSPDVHRLLADRQAHVSNGDAAAVKAVDEQLAELGFTAS